MAPVSQVLLHLLCPQSRPGAYIFHRGSSCPEMGIIFLSQNSDFSRSCAFLRLSLTLPQSISFCLTLFHPHWPPFCSSNLRSSLLFGGLCACCSLCQHCSAELAPPHSELSSNDTSSQKLILSNSPPSFSPIYFLSSTYYLPLPFPFLFSVSPTRLLDACGQETCLSIAVSKGLAQ